MPDLEPEELQASLAYAAQKFDHPILVAALWWYGFMRKSRQ